MLVAQSCPTLCDPTDCSLPGSSVHGILQARILEWVPIPSQGIFPTQGLNPGLQFSHPLNFYGMIIYVDSIKQIHEVKSEVMVFFLVF